ncbi:MAG TPA: hypothetical protein VNO22_03695 [Planctomycetota bacterium]|nr:hypothetical protein [Planctomycetota bacterium]
MGRWKERLERMGRAGEEARLRELRSMSLERAVRILEGLLSHPLARPRRARRRHPVSLSRLLRRR